MAIRRKQKLHQSIEWMTWRHCEGNDHNWGDYIVNNKHLYFVCGRYFLNSLSFILVRVHHNLSMGRTSTHALCSLFSTNQCTHSATMYAFTTIPPSSDILCFRVSFNLICTALWNFYFWSIGNHTFIATVWSGHCEFIMTLRWIKQSVRGIIIKCKQFEKRKGTFLRLIQQMPLLLQLLRLMWLC